MMVAANQGHKGVVEMLIDAGADVTVKDEVSFLLNTKKITVLEEIHCRITQLSSSCEIFCCVITLSMVCCSWETQL